MMSTRFKTYGVLLIGLILTLSLHDSLLAQKSPSTSKSTGGRKPASAKPKADKDDDEKTGTDDEESSDGDKDEKDAKKKSPTKSTSKAGKKTSKSAYKREQSVEIGPLTEQPLLAMEVRDHNEIQNMREHGEEAYIEAETNLTKFEEMLRSNQAKGINLEEVGNTFVPIMHVERMATRLSILGEPAGWELGARHAILRQRIFKLTADIRSLPGMSEKLADTRPLVLSTKKGESGLIKVDQLIKKNQIPAAETLMCDILDAVHCVGILYDPGVAVPVHMNINKADETTKVVFLGYRNKVAKEELGKERKKTTPDFKKLLQELQAATTEISGGNDPKFGDKASSGPEWLKYFAERWQKTYFTACNCYGLDLTRNMHEPSAIADADQLSRDYQEFVNAVLTGIAGLINADISRTQPDQASQIYADYVNVVAGFTALGDPQTVFNAVQPALDAFAAKFPELQAEVGAYFGFSTELLRWRQRVAEGYMNARLSEYQLVGPTFNAAIPDPKLPENPTIFDLESIGNHLRLVNTAPVAIHAVSPGIIGKKVYAQAGLSSRNERLHVTSYEEGSVYATIPQDVNLSLAVDELKHALLVSDSLPPLTLEAALAVETARQGDLWQFGGEVTDVELEGRITKIANSNADDWGLVYLTSTMTRPDRGYSLQHVMVQCHLRPEWLRHQYFFVALN
ncbi:MAG: hypothetical protein ACKVT0_19475 [Planctomycetaceae bacterium]